MNVFVLGAVEKCRRARLFLNRVERGGQRFTFSSGKNADIFERARIRLRAADIGMNQAAVEMQRAGEALEHLRGAVLEPAAPQFHTVFFADFCREART